MDQNDKQGTKTTGCGGNDNDAVRIDGKRMTALAGHPCLVFDPIVDDEGVDDDK